MTRDQRELLIKDLYARLPYGVKGIYNFCDDIDTITGITDCDSDVNLIYSENGNVGAISDIIQFKPILFPLSAIDKEIEVGGKKVVVKTIIENNFHESFYIDLDGDINIEMSDASYIYGSDYIYILDTFHRYHIDYRNLIGQGLAISVFDLPENPYRL